MLLCMCNPLLVWVSLLSATILSGWEADKQRLLTMPFRDAWRGAKMAWEGVRRALTGGGFVKMTVGDRKCKLDVATGWALDDGLALQKLVRIEKQGQ
ncbi:hypothetical protein BN1723_018623, partial [Verticillium longisporum]